MDLLKNLKAPSPRSIAEASFLNIIATFFGIAISTLSLQTASGLLFHLVHSCLETFDFSVSAFVFVPLGFIILVCKADNAMVPSTRSDTVQLEANYFSHSRFSSRENGTQFSSASRQPRSAEAVRWIANFPGNIVLSYVRAS